MNLVYITFELSKIDWTAVGAIVTFIMMTATFYTVHQNSKQLKELKRQWKEQNRPVLAIGIFPYDRSYYLEIHNLGNRDANNVILKIDQIFLNNIPNLNKEIFKNAMAIPFYVKAGKSVYYYIGECEEINNEWRNRDFSIIVDCQYNDEYNIHISYPVKHFIKKLQFLVRTPIEKALEDISEGLVRPHVITKPKAIQLNIQSISESLKEISRILKENYGTEQDK